MAFALSSTVLLGIRAVQALFTVIVLATAGHVAAWWNNAWHAASPSEFNFLIFTALWTLLVLIYLIVVPLRFSNSVLHHRFAILALECITMLFWFAAFVAAAVFLTGRVCYGEICSSAKASTVFAAFEWLLFAITAALAVLHVFASTKHHEDPVGVQEKATPANIGEKPVGVQEKATPANIDEKSVGLHEGV